MIRWSPGVLMRSGSAVVGRGWLAGVVLVGLVSACTGSATGPSTSGVLSAPFPPADVLPEYLKGALLTSDGLGEGWEQARYTPRDGLWKCIPHGDLQPAVAGIEAVYWFSEGGGMVGESLSWYGDEAKDVFESVVEGCPPVNGFVGVYGMGIEEPWEAGYGPDPRSKLVWWRVGPVIGTLWLSSNPTQIESFPFMEWVTAAIDRLDATLRASGYPVDRSGLP